MRTSEAPPGLAAAPEPPLRWAGRALTGWPATGVSFAAGGLLVLAFAPFDLYPVAPVALALWFALLRGSVPRESFRHGYAFGLGFFGFGVTWVFNSLLIFGQAPWVVATVITCAFVLLLSLYPALLAWLAARVVGKAGLVAWLLALAAGYVLLEGLRGWLLSGFPWLLLGHVLLESPVRSWIPLGGEPAAGLWVALLAASLVLLLARRMVAALLLIVGLLAGAAAITPWHWVEPSGPPLRVAVIQGNIDQGRKWQDDGIEHALATYSSLSLPVAGVDLLVWPETAIPAFYAEVYTELDALSERLELEGTELVTGIFDFDPVDRAMYNSIRHLPSGAVYDKRQLVPFGEYLPLRQRLDWLDRLLDIPMSDLSAGTGDGLVAMAGQLAGLSVCYEAAYAGRIRAALPDATFLLNVSNDAWFGNTLAPHQHLQIARFRALEAGRPMIRATNTGISALIAADGRVTAQSGLFTREVLQGEILPHVGATPAVRFGSWPAFAFAGLLLLPALWSRRRR